MPFKIPEFQNHKMIRSIQNILKNKAVTVRFNFYFIFVFVCAAARDDGSVAVALGYTAHIVLMISYFLQVPLRYPVVHKGSRSSIKDNITDQLAEKERE